MLPRKISTTHKGFTLVEIMVVLALIGILASIVLISLSQARESGKIGKAKEELKNIEQAFKLYRQEQGVMPPGVDHCSYCRVPPYVGGMSWVVPPPDFRNDWGELVVYLLNSTPAVIPIQDPWGNEYVYDNNYLVTNPLAPSMVCSLGLDGALNTWLTPGGPYPKVASGDDICVFFPETDDTP